MLSFSEKFGLLPRTSASRYFWWLAFVDQPSSSTMDHRGGILIKIPVWRFIFDEVNVMMVKTIKLANRDLNDLSLGNRRSVRHVTCGMKLLK